jgi:hypothetical protein
MNAPYVPAGNVIKLRNRITLSGFWCLIFNYFSVILSARWSAGLIPKRLRFVQHNIYHFFC